MKNMMKAGVVVFGLFGVSSGNAMENCYDLAQQNVKSKMKLCIKINKKETKKGWQKAEITLKSKKDFYIRSDSYVLIDSKFQKGVNHNKLIFLDTKGSDDFKDRLSEFMFKNVNPIEFVGRWDPVSRVERGDVKFGKKDVYSYSRKWNFKDPSGIMLTEK